MYVDVEISFLKKKMHFTVFGGGGGEILRV